MKMSDFQREGLHLLGYNRKESEFLYLVATHSGYFTTRQFKTFVGTESGSITHAFVQKLLAQKHATFRAYRSGGRVYHVFARKVYQAIQRENLRTRKKHEIEYVKTRLVTLDFILGHLENHYLETEGEKLSFFTGQYNISLETLPVKHYRARKSADVTPRYFVDRFPMFVDLKSPSPTVTFSFVDSGAIGLDSFRTHLRAYLPLFRALPKFEFLYLAPTQRLFQSAQDEFERTIYGRDTQTIPVSLLDYFRLRKAWDVKERVASVDVVRLKEAQARYRDARIEELYEKWRVGAINDDVTQQLSPLRQSRTASFRTLLCGTSLTIFTEPLRQNPETSEDTEVMHDMRQFSSESSLEASE